MSEQDDKLKEAAERRTKEFWPGNPLFKLGYEDGFLAGAAYEREQTQDQVNDAYTKGVCDGVAVEQENQSKRVCSNCQFLNPIGCKCGKGVRGEGWDCVCPDFGCNLWREK